MNPFGGNPPTQTVDSLLGKSYHVVKTVYLHLPLLKKINESEAINFFFEHWDTVQNIESNIDAIKDIGANLEELLKAPEYIEEVKQEGQKQIDAIWEAKEEALKDFNILELSRTGVTSIQLGDDVPNMNIINNFEY